MTITRESEDGRRRSKDTWATREEVKESGLEIELSKERREEIYLPITTPV